MKQYIPGWMGIIAVIAMAIPAPCLAQDSARGAIVQGPPGARPDTTRRDSVARDSVARDSVGRDSTPPKPPPRPVDSAVGAACKRSGGASPDLVLVTFRATATAEDRAAVAGEIGGKLVSQSEQQPGAWYLRVPGSANDPTVADRLIMMSPVQEVGETRCPG